MALGIVSVLSFEKPKMVGKISNAQSASISWDFFLPNLGIPHNSAFELWELGEG